MTNSSKLFSFSDEFTEWAKQEDMVNNQMNSNWIPAYVIITLVPIGFILSAVLASRKETKRQASERAARAARIGELLPLWLRDMVGATTRTSANNDSQAATGTEQQQDGSNGIEPTDLEAGLANKVMPTVTITPAAAAAETAPADPRARADSMKSDTGAVIDGGAKHGADDASPPRRQRRGPSAGKQPRGHERAVAGPSRSAEGRRARRMTVWPSFAD